MATTSLSTQIYSSRDSVRTQIITLLQSYLEMENVDLTKSSFLSYLIDVLSSLTSNLMFFVSSTYNEMFMTQAQLPESIYNLSAFLGYNAQLASANFATANVLFSIPLTFTSYKPDHSVSFTIPEDHKYYSGDIVFTPDYSTEVTVTNNSTATVEVTKDNKKYTYPTTIDSTSESPMLYFVLPVYQKQPYTNESQVSSDLQTYQFITIDIPFTEGELTDIIVYVTNPGSTRTAYTRYDSIYLMTSETYGFVLQTVSDGYRIYFGNGLMGVQPEAGATVEVEGYKTIGANGNVIAGSLTQLDRITVDDGGTETKILSCTITNAYPASGGTDSESIEEIRSNAIAGLTTLGRLVTENDYTHVDVVAPSAPVEDSISVLKRSDLKVNEIQMFTKLLYNNEMVETRNAYHRVNLGVTSIPAGTTITVDSVEYRNLFDITIDSQVNNIATYDYVISEVEISPTIYDSYSITGTTPDLINSSFVVVRSGNAINIYAYYQTSGSVANIEAVLVNRHTNDRYTMIKDEANSRYTYQFASYMSLQDSPIQWYIEWWSAGELFVKYTATTTIRQNLDYMMMSNISVDSTSVIVFDIPTVLKSWYDGLTCEEVISFETTVIQSLFSNLIFSNYRMLTDFTNLKFTNTTGYLNNMQYNLVTKSAVIDIGVTTIPVSPSIGDRYIVTGNEGGDWEDHPGEIAQCTDSTGPTWTYIVPQTNDIVNVTNKGSRYTYTEFGWMVPSYRIPLQIIVEVYKTRVYTGTSAELISAIKTQLLSDFEDRFGASADIYRSELIDSIMSVTGVSYCRLMQPKSDIFFTFEMDDLTQSQLLRYGPEYVYFTTDSITVTVLGSTN